MTERITDLVSQIKTGITKAAPNAGEKGLPNTPKDRVSVEGEASFKKYGDAALRKNVARGLFAVSTGIGLNPVIAAALTGTMVAAATMFIDDPSLARTEKGAKMLAQLMTNVEGFMGLGADKVKG